jgi:periplasmic protein TonB
MNGGGFLEQKPRSPTGLVIVVAMHAAVITALALSKMDVPMPVDFGPLITRNIPIPPEPDPIPPEPKPQPKAEPQARSEIMVPPREVDTPVREPTTFTTTREPARTDWPSLPPGPANVESTPQPKETPLARDPVRTDATMLASVELLPPYPAAEERAEREGGVTVRLLVGADGRVKKVERVSAASEAFWRATERHALRAWRFKPATVDGKPVESWKTVSVRFVLQG